MSLEDHQLGHYRLQRLIGRGTGEVYLAEDLHVSRQVAVKVICTEEDPYGISQEAERLFQREMRAISLLDHPHILPVFDYGTEQIHNIAYAYLVMPYRPEGSLADWLRKRGPETLPTPDEVAHILLQAADVLQQAHERHIVHQDIKPSNFLICRRNSTAKLPDVLLADFGISKFINSSSSTSQSVRGTPMYMSPEQWEGQPVPASDQYSLAIMAFQLLTGNFPFRGGPSQVMRQHFTTRPPAPSTLNPGLSSKIDAVILRALAKQPEERFPSVLQFAQAFQQALSQENESQSTTIAPEKNSQAGTHALFVSREQLMASPDPSHTPQEVASVSESPHSLLQANTVSPSTPVTPALPSPSSASVTQEPGMFALPTMSSNLLTRLRFRPSRFQKLLLAAVVILIVLGSGSMAFVHVASRSAASGTQETANAIQHSGYPTMTQATATMQAKGSVAQTNATASAQVDKHVTEATTANDPYLSGKAKLLASDSLEGPKLWKEKGSGSWGGICTFKDGAYHITQNIGPNRFFHCDTGAFQSNNFIYEVQITIVRGNCGGITFRSSLDSVSKDRLGYRFRVCADGVARLDVYSDAKVFTTLFSGTSPALRKGFNQTNIVAVLANGTHIDLYINKQKIASVTDYALDRGTFTLFALNIDKPTDVAFRNAKIWQL